MRRGVESHYHIGISEGNRVPDPVLLKGPAVNYSDLKSPHAGHGVQDNHIPPKLAVQHVAAVLPVAIGTGEGGIQVGNAICLVEVGTLGHHHPLPVSDHPVSYLTVEISVRIIREFLFCHEAHAKPLLQA